MKNSRAIAVSAAAALVLAGMAGPALANPNKGPGNNGNPNNGKKMAQAIKIENVWKHLEPSRTSPTPTATAPPAHPATRPAPSTSSPSCRPPATRPSASTSTSTCSAATRRRGCSDADFVGFTPGNIALIGRGSCFFDDKTLNAAAAGASAVSAYNNEDGDLFAGLDPLDDLVPTSTTTQADGEAILAQLAVGPVSATLNIEGRVTVESISTFNVLTETAKGRTDNVVMLGPHLDSVAEAQGSTTTPRAPPRSPRPRSS